MDREKLKSKIDQNLNKANKELSELNEDVGLSIYFQLSETFLKTISDISKDIFRFFKEAVDDDPPLESKKGKISLANIDMQGIWDNESEIVETLEETRQLMFKLFKEKDNAIMDCVELFSSEEIQKTTLRIEKILDQIFRISWIKQSTIARNHLNDYFSNSRPSSLDLMAHKIDINSSLIESNKHLNTFDVKKAPLIRIEKAMDSFGKSINIISAILKDSSLMDMLDFENSEIEKAKEQVMETKEKINQLINDLSGGIAEHILCYSEEINPNADQEGVDIKTKGEFEDLITELGKSAIQIKKLSERITAQNQKADLLLDMTINLNDKLALLEALLIRLESKVSNVKSDPIFYILKEIAMKEDECLTTDGSEPEVYKDPSQNQDEYLKAIIQDTESAQMQVGTGGKK